MKDTKGMKRKPGELSWMFFMAFMFFMVRALSHAQTPRADVLDVHHLPLGDGRVSAEPKVGFVFSCQQRFDPNAPGARIVGPWIHGSTWDLTEKIGVEGRVTWPSAEFRITASSAGRVVSRVLSGNGLPVDTPTGTFPVARTDPAFAIDGNP